MRQRWTYYAIYLVGTPSKLSVVHTLTSDVQTLVMALPLRLLWGLHVTRGQKAALGAIFGLGAIIIVFAIVRVIYTKATTHHVDPIWLALWSMVEASVGMVALSLGSSSHEPQVTD